MGVLNLLKVVNEARVGYCKAYEARQFIRFLKKPDVHCVWLANGGRKKSKEARIQLIIHSIRHGTNLIINRIGQSFNFSNYRLGKTQKKKVGAIFEKISYIV